MSCHKHLQQMMESIDEFARRAEQIIDPTKLTKAIKYITMDRNGALYGWSHKPKISRFILVWTAIEQNSTHCYLARIDPKELDWKLCCLSIPLEWRERSHITASELMPVQSIQEFSSGSAPDAWI